VDDLRRLAPASPASVGSLRRALSAGGVCTVVEVAMTRLEDEFRHMLSARVLDLEIEALAGLSSLSMASDRSNSDATEAAAGEEDDGSVSSSVDGRSSYRSLQSIREIDLFPADAISDLHTKVRSAHACHPSPIMRSDIILFLKEGSRLKVDYDVT
jgi:exocyst complex component 7